MATLTETKFSDIYIMAENKKAYIHDETTLNSLKEFAPDDLENFYDLVANSYDGVNSSYSVKYNNI